MSRWFRYYDNALNDPKVQQLPADLFKAWVNLLCLASQGDGKIKSVGDAAFALRLSAAKAGAVVALLAGHGLLDHVTGGYFEPHNWDKRQFKSDVSNERVKRHRNAQCNVTSTVTETPPETEQIQNTDTEKKVSRAVGKPTRTDLDRDFEKFKKAFPKRKGAQPWKPAKRLFEKVMAEGTCLDQMLAALSKGIGFDRDKIGTEFIPQAVKWLRDERWRDTTAASGDDVLSDQERDQLFAKLREKPNDQSGQRTELREAGVSSREVQGEGREGSAGPPDNRTRNAGMVSLAAVFREPSGFRAGSHEAGSNGDEPADDGPRTMAARF